MSVRWVAAKPTSAGSISSRVSASSREKLGRIRGPAGLFESGKSASSIALSILAEIMQANVGAATGAGLLSQAGETSTLLFWEPSLRRCQPAASLATRRPRYDIPS